uniref:DNA replication factor Cdt1 n=1 Tax=Cacopsylla melanoneura TaxID=428564 RepID=A0A8D9A4G9_9HEMI
MATQPSIKQFFKSRKRPASVLKKDANLSDRPAKVFVTDEQFEDKTLHAKILYKQPSPNPDDEVSQINSGKDLAKPLSTNIDTSKEIPARPITPDNFISVKPPVTPTTIRNDLPTTPSHKNVLPERPSTPESSRETLEAIQKETLTGINDLKKKARIQKKLLAVKQSVDKFNQHSSRLEAIQNALRATDIDLPRDTDHSEPISPRKTPLRQRLIIPKERSIYGSPQKQYVSPRKLLLDGPVTVTSPIKQMPAYKRFADLTAIQEKGTLILPYKYRILAEVFRAVDTIVSMIYTRGENITFDKLQAGVASMIKKQLTHTHLGQIKTILPNSYSFSLEKVHKFGTAAGQADKYQLLIKPILKSASNSDTSSGSMNSALLLNRRRDFHKKLMDLTKEYHEKFLLALVPPVFLDKDKLTRWHPEFELERVPDIEAADIPHPKKEATNTSAKQLLDRAKSLLSVNRKLGAALNKIPPAGSVPGTPSSTNNADPSIGTPRTPSTKLTPSSSVLNTPSSHSGTPCADLTPCTPSSQSTAEDSVTPTSSHSTQAVVEGMEKAIKGIPKGLLEKIRARQAAKALASMTQSPADIAEAVMLSRLPEMARILRVLYVAEKRSVLPLDNVVHRIAHSFREHLSPVEIRRHLNLLASHTPEWASFQSVRQKEFFKIAKDSDLHTVVSKLQELAQTKDKTM